MKKSILLFVSIISLTSLQAKIDRPDSQPSIKLSKFKGFLRELDDFLFIEWLGRQAVDLKNEHYIRTIIHDLDMDDYCIEIRRMSNFAKNILGRENAFVLPSIFWGKKSHSYLYVSEDWFSGLTDVEKQGLIRHELMHIRYNHGLKRAVFGSAIFIILGQLENLTNVHKNESARNLHNVAFDIFRYLLVYKYSRICEKEADIEAAKSMHSSTGCVELFNNIKENIDPESKFKIKRLIGKLIQPIMYYFSSHPTLDERIDYLESLQLEANS